METIEIHCAYVLGQWGALLFRLDLLVCVAIRFVIEGSVLTNISVFYDGWHMLIPLLILFTSSKCRVGCRRLFCRAGYSPLCKTTDDIEWMSPCLPSCSVLGDQRDNRLNLQTLSVEYIWKTLRDYATLCETSRVYVGFITVPALVEGQPLEEWHLQPRRIPTRYDPLHSREKYYPTNPTSVILSLGDLGNGLGVVSVLVSFQLCHSAWCDLPENTITSSTAGE